MYIAKVWDLRSGLCVRHLQSSGMYYEGENEKIPRQNYIPSSESIIYDCIVDYNNKFMFTSFGSSVRVWSLDTFTTVFVLSGNHVYFFINYFNKNFFLFFSEEVSCMAMSKTSTNLIRLVCGSRDCKVSVYDFNSNTLKCELRGILRSSHKDLVTAICCYKDSVFSASRDKVNNKIFIFIF